MSDVPVTSNEQLADTIEPYLQALTRYIDGVYSMAIEYSVPAKDAAFHAKHMQDAVLGIRRLLHHELCDMLDVNAEGIKKPCNCKGRAVETTRESFQYRVLAWARKCFWRPDALEPPQRSFRFVEEALELVQAVGTTREDVLRLVDYVYGRPSGDPAQEIGGVMVTLAALASSLGKDLHECADVELSRCIANIERIREKDLRKPARSSLPGSSEKASTPRETTKKPADLSYDEFWKRVRETGWNPEPNDLRALLILWESEGGSAEKTSVTTGETK